MAKEKSPYAEVWQIGVLVRDLDEAVKYYESLGIGPFVYSTGGTPVYREVYGKPAPDVTNRVASAQMGAVSFELVQPVTGKSVQREFLEKHGEGINHLGFMVDDVDKEVARMAKKGFKVVSSGREVAGAPFRFAYLDTDKVGGVVFEIVKKR
ncbi:MAG: VOC family protein [Dehalococcoidales bacterium]|nr:VOC family protein [Dehalococcoidales bacterium]